MVLNPVRIEQFYNPLSGTIYRDEQPTSDLNVQEYRKQLVLVSLELLQMKSQSLVAGLKDAQKARTKATSKEFLSQVSK